MSPDPPDPDVIDLTQLHLGGSEFALNGFAALDAQKQPKEEDNKSDRADSLFGDDGHTAAGDRTGSSNDVKREEGEPSNFIQSGPALPPGQPAGDAVSNVPLSQRNQGPKPPSEKGNAAAEEDSDDDLMIVDEDSVPAHVKAMFTANPWRPITPDLEIVGVRVKQEPRSPRHFIDLDEDLPVPDVKHEPRSNSDAGSLFGDVFGDNDMSGVNPGPGAAAGCAAAVREDDEAMFVDELFPPAGGDDVPMDVDNAIKAEKPPPAANIDNGADTAGTPHVAAASHGGDGGQVADIVQETDDTHTLAAADEVSGAAPAVSAGDVGASGTAAPDVGDGDVGADGNDDHGEDNGGDEADEDAVGGAGDDADDDADGDAGNDEAFVIGDDQELSDGEQPRARRRKAPQKKKGKQKASAAADEDDFQDLDELSPEDMAEELELIQAEMKVFAQRKAKGKLGPGDMNRMQSVGKRYSSLKQRITQPQRRVADLAQEELRKMMEKDGAGEDDSAEDNGQPGPSHQRATANRLPAIARRGSNSASGSRKRRWRPMPGSSNAKSKKQKTGRGKGVDHSSTTQMILKMVRSHDPIMARAEQDDMRLFDNFEATTIRDQIAQLKQQLKADPEGDLKRAFAELRKLEWARTYFRGRKYCKPKDGFWLITGLKKPLHHYQLFGAGWMLHRELHPEGPYGGILADQVGLGKTIEALACILGNAPPPDAPPGQELGTLVVVPANIVGQWRSEIHQCCPHLNVVVYHSSKNHRVWMEDLQKADIVITTYQEVNRGYPSRDRVKELDALDVAERAAKFEAALGTLFKVEWRRVILDEAHAIKNHHTHTSKACIQLQGKYRWALTATPIHNGVHEIYPYMLFIRSPAAETFREFKKKTSDISLEDAERIKELFGDVIMLRQLKTLFLGKALFEMPRTHPLPNSWITLSEEETIIYRRIESKVRENFNRAIQGHGDNRRKSPTSFFSVIMRLRQAAAHPFMLFSMMRDVFDLEDIKAIRQKFLEIKQRSPERPFIEQVGRWFETRLEDGKLIGQVAPGNLDGPFGIGDHGLSFEMDPQLEQLEKAKALGGSTCNICNQPHVAPRQTRCEHVFCLSCLEALIEIAKEEENDTIECPTCSAEHNVDEIMVPPDAQGGSQSQSRRRSGKKGRNINLDMPGNDCNGFQPVGDEDGAKFLEECDTNINLPLAASAKTAMVKDIILKWQRAKPGDKIIVFTQWVMVGRILGRVLEQEQIKFLYYFGEMSREEKEDNIKDFHSKPDIKVLVASLRCGGQGLNLTCANRVIMIDPWWNSALEHQAYGRVFRMGQMKETYYVRLLTRKTIDGRMAKLQNEKLRQINSVVDEYDSTRQSIKFEEVAELFGRVKRDEDGNAISVESDYETDDEEAFEDNDENDDDNGDNGGAGFDPGAAGGASGMGFGDSVINGYGIQDLI